MASNGALVETKMVVDHVNILIMWMLHIETLFQQKIVWKTINIKSTFKIFRIFSIYIINGVGLSKINDRLVKMRSYLLEQWWSKGLRLTLKFSVSLTAYLHNSNDSYQCDYEVKFSCQKITLKRKHVQLDG